MNTLANVEGTSNSLWWALNCVSLLFACNKCGTTVLESPYTDTILFADFPAGKSGIPGPTFEGSKVGPRYVRAGLPKVIGTPTVESMLN